MNTISLSLGWRTPGMCIFSSWVSFRSQFVFDTFAIRNAIHPRISTNMVSRMHCHSRRYPGSALQLLRSQQNSQAFIPWNRSLVKATDKEVYSRFEYRPSESRLLRLPPEIRKKIWQHVLGDHKIIYFERSLKPITLTLGWKPLHIRSESKQATMEVCERPDPFCSFYLPIGDTLDLNFQRTCRQIYAETDYLFYTTKPFYFDDNSLATFSETEQLFSNATSRKFAFQWYTTSLHGPESWLPTSFGAYKECQTFETSK